MHMDPLIPYLAGAVLVVVGIGLTLRRFQQPLVVAYLLAGVVLGPHATGWIESSHVLEELGALGVLLLLFFVGMEISPAALLARWRVAVIGTALQVGVSVGLVALAGIALEWELPRIVLLGFVLSLSSTAVVLKLVRENRDEDPEVAQDVTAVLLAQDLAIVPMMIAISFLHGTEVPAEVLWTQGIGALGATALVAWICRRKVVRLPFARALRTDEELQVFVALLVCFGFAVLAAVLQLSAALGAFLAGLLVGAAKETRHFHEHLKPFEVVFVAAFFVSIGLLIDLEFLSTHWMMLAFLVALVFATNTGINAPALRVAGSSWRRSLYSASLLAQIGEFSFVLALVGYQSGIIEEFAYQTTLSVISLSLLVSPAWIVLVRRLTRPSALPLPGAPANTP